MIHNINALAREIGSKYGVKTYATSTMMSWSKAELIEHIRILEHNYMAMLSLNQQQASNFGDILDGMIGVSGTNTKGGEND